MTWQTGSILFLIYLVVQYLDWRLNLKQPAGGRKQAAEPLTRKGQPTFWK